MCGIALAEASVSQTQENGFTVVSDSAELFTVLCNFAIPGKSP